MTAARAKTYGPEIGGEEKTTEGIEGVRGGVGTVAGRQSGCSPLM